MPAPKSLHEALLNVQKSAPSLQKSGFNPAFKSKYLSLDTIMPQILPLLNEQNLVLTQEPSNIDGAPALTTRITFVGTGGGAIESTMPLLIDKQNSQGLGSALTYSRRYSVLAILGLVADTDDDGAAASTKDIEIVKPRRSRAAQTGATGSGSASAQEDW